MKLRALLETMVAVGLAGMGCGRDVAPSDEAPARSGKATLGGAPLPNWATPEELARRPASKPARARVNRAPPAGLRVPAEYEPQRAVLMTWAGFRPLLGETAEAVATAQAEVWMVGGPATLAGVPASQYRALPLDFDSVWARDYGPVGIDESDGRLGLVDTTYRHYATRRDDDALPCQVAQAAGNLACYGTDLILDGGNFMTDGRGSVFFTTRLYDWNADKTREEVDQLLRDYFGATALHPLPYAKRGTMPADGTGHIDMFAKLLSDCSVMVAQTDTEPFRSVTEEAANTFASLTCPDGGPYQVHRVPGWWRRGSWYTYTNALIVNDTVIVPSYASGDDAAAKRAYEVAMPGYRVALVDSDESIISGGAVHCVTQNVPAR